MIYPDIWEEKMGGCLVQTMHLRRVAALFLADRCPCLNAAKLSDSVVRIHTAPTSPV